MNGEHAVLEIDVFIVQRQCLGDSHPGAGDQTEQGLEDGPAQSRRWPKLPCGSQQIDDLLFAVNVRRLSLRQSAEDCVVGNFGAWLELLQPTQKGTQQLQSARPSERVSASVAVAPRPVSHKFHGQRTTMTTGLDVAREVTQGICLGMIQETQTATFDQIEIDTFCRAVAALMLRSRATAGQLR